MKRILEVCLLALWVISFGTAAAAAGHEETVEQRIEELEHELEELKQAVENGTPPVGASGKSGSVLGPWDVTDSITFKPGLRLQTRYTYETNDDHRIFVRRFRMKGGGKIDTIAKYYAELKIDNTGKSKTGAAVENAWVQFNPFQDVYLRVGLGDVPFSRLALTSDSKILFMDRGLIKDALSAQGLADNGIGAFFHGRPFGGHLEYAVGVFQNEDFMEAPMPMGRVVVNLLDPATQGGYADYRGSYIGEGQRLSIGANAGYVADAKHALIDGFPRTFDLYGWGVDAFFNKGPLTLQAEYDRFERMFNGTVPGSATGSATKGFTVQGAYLLPIQQIFPSFFPDTEIAGRYQWIDDAVKRDRLRYTSVGLNFYLRKHNLKILADYTFKRERRAEANNNMAQVQLQLDF